MNVTPPQIPASPPPPAPKSNVLKWVLIGCGGLTLLGILACGGCMALVYFTVKKVAAEAVAKVKPIIADNETVKAEIGEVTSVNPRFEVRSDERAGRKTVMFTLDVEGTKGKGVVEVTMTERNRRQDEMIVVLTFTNSATSKKTPLGTWRLYDDGKGNAGFEPLKEAPADVPGPDSDD